MAASPFLPAPIRRTTIPAQTPTVFDGLPECRLLSNGFGSGVNHWTADSLVLGPRRDQSPAQEVDVALTVSMLPDDRDRLGGSDVDSLQESGGVRWRAVQHVTSIS